MQDIKLLQIFARINFKIIFLQDLFKILPQENYLAIFLARVLQDFYISTKDTAKKLCNTKDSVAV